MSMLRAVAVALILVPLGCASRVSGESDVSDASVSNDGASNDGARTDSARCCKLDTPGCGCVTIGTRSDGTCDNICDARPDQFALETDSNGCPRYRVGPGSCLEPRDTGVYTPDTADASVSCPTSAASCPSACSNVTARAYDTAQGCLLPSKTVGCIPLGSGCTAALTCLVRTADGAAFWFPGQCFFSTAEWSACDSTTAGAVLGAKECPG